MLFYSRFVRMYLKYITLDDNPVHLQQLDEVLQQVPQCECLNSFSNPLEAFQFLQENSVDIVFMDIEMPELSGIELAKQLQNPPLFVFVSSHPEFGAETYEVDAIDYIIKPIGLERVLKAFKRIYKFLETKSQASHEIQMESHTKSYFFIRENQQHIKIEYKDLVYAESLNSFTHLHMSNGKKHLVLVGLKSLEEQLSKTFFLRISRSILVNKDKITSYSSTHVCLNQLSFGIGPKYGITLQDTLGQLTISRFGD